MGSSFMVSFISFSASAMVLKIAFLSSASSPEEAINIFKCLIFFPLSRDLGRLKIINPIFFAIMKKGLVSNIYFING